MSQNAEDQFLGEELAASENTRDTARFEVVPCGLEATVSYGTGAAQGPSAILAASQQLADHLLIGVGTFRQNK